MSHDWREKDFKPRVAREAAGNNLGQSIPNKSPIAAPKKKVSIRFRPVILLALIFIPYCIYFAFFRGTPDDTTLRLTQEISDLTSQTISLNGANKKLEEENVRLSIENKSQDAQISTFKKSNNTLLRKYSNSNNLNADFKNGINNLCKYNYALQDEIIKRNFDKECENLEKLLD